MDFSHIWHESCLYVLLVKLNKCLNDEVNYESYGISSDGFGWVDCGACFWTGLRKILNNKP